MAVICTISAFGKEVPQIIVGTMGHKYKLVEATTWDTSYGVKGVRAKYKLPRFMPRGIAPRDFRILCKSPESYGFKDMHPEGWGDARCKTYQVSFVVEAE